MYMSMCVHMRVNTCEYVYVCEYLFTCVSVLYERDPCYKRRGRRAWNSVSSLLLLLRSQSIKTIYLEVEPSTFFSASTTTRPTGGRLLWVSRLSNQLSGNKRHFNSSILSSS